MKYQKESLNIQIKELEGARSLCRKLKKENNFMEMNPDEYLEFIKEEEKKGNLFSNVTELLNEYTESADYNHQFGNTMFYYLGQKGKYVTGFFYIGILAVEIYVLICACIGKILPNAMIIFWSMLLIAQVVDFVKYRKNNRLM